MRYFFQFLILFFAINLVAQNGIAIVGNDLKFSKGNSEISKENAFESSFELYDRMIVVEAILDGKVGKYILDTGSPVLILNQIPQKEFTSLEGISEENHAEVIEVKSFQWAGILNTEIVAVAYDMSNLEKALGHKIDGLIGQNVLNDLELFLDISNRKIQLFKAYRSSFHKSKNHKQKVSFSDNCHLPIISIKIDGKKYHFGIDTGAEVNVLNKNLKDTLDEEILSNFTETNLHGLGGTSQKVESANLSLFKIKELDCENYNFLLTDLTSFEKKYSHTLDGILGHPFLLKNILSINYQKQKIYFW